MSLKQILVITDRRDAHLPFVQKHLAEPLVVIDPLEAATTKALSYEYSEGYAKVKYDGVKLNPVGVWFRKPGSVKRSSLKIDSRFHEYALGSIQKHFSSLMSAFPDALWASDLYAITRASDKPLQLLVAQELGFEVPDTLFTSDSAAAEAFVGRHGSCIVKPVVPLIEKAGSNRQKSLYSTKITSETLPDLRSLRQSPLIFQQAISAAYDVRVTVVGDRAFAARIEYRGKAEGVRDWRLGHYEGELTIEPDRAFPKDVEQKCIEHVRRLNLNYGAIDLVVDSDGVYWFLENNPNGQWAFVEQATGQPIGKALAEMLEMGTKK